MNSLGASSKWPSYDSLRSNSSFLPSEGEQTEDEADVFSEPEGEGGKKVCLLSDEDVSRPYLRFGSNQLYERNPPGLDIPDRYPAASASPGAAELGSSLQTPGDLAFAQKCADLHRFIHPLFELLHGLKMGRFDKGLNGFQQSVAIDRLQKILGILQRPEMGEKYLQNLLQIEMLLKAWFPQRALKSTNRQTPPSTLTPHWHQNQLHMPVKKRKLSWPDPRDAGGVPAKRKHHQQEHGRCDAPPLAAAATCLPPSPKKQTPPGEERPHLTGSRRDAGQTLTDSHCRVIRWLWSNGKHQNPNPELPSCESPAMQDSSVSSSNGAAAALLNQQ